MEKVSRGLTERPLVGLSPSLVDTDTTRSPKAGRSRSSLAAGGWIIWLWPAGAVEAVAGTTVAAVAAEALVVCAVETLLWRLRNTR